MQKPQKTSVIRKESPTVLSAWLAKLRQDQRFWAFSKADAGMIMDVAVEAHFKTVDRMNADAIKESTITELVQQYFQHTAQSWDELAMFLYQEAPKRLLTQSSLRRQHFLEHKAGLGRLRDGKRAQCLAEILYLTLAILEDREQRGTSMAM